MKKVVINSCHGGFGLSHEAVVRYAELKGFDLEIRPEVSSLVPYSWKLWECVCDVTARCEDWEILGGAEGKELCNALATTIHKLKGT